MIRAASLTLSCAILFAVPAMAQSPGPSPEAPAAASPAPQGAAAPAAEQSAAIEDCLKRMNALINHALTLKLPDDKVEKAENALATMEQSCVEQRFDEASATESDIRRIIAAQSEPADGGK
jgi:hypothetical protein